MITTHEYFDGRVKSLGFEEKGKKTVGVMLPGSYTFGTTTHETMQVISGVLNIQLPGSDTWQTFGPGETFEVEADKEFQVEIEVPSSYLCSYS